MSVTSARQSAAPDERPPRGREITRQRILASAIRLFAERGVHDVTSHDIANAAGVAAGTFYNHFADKHALFREIAFSSIDQLKRNLAEASAGMDEREPRVRKRAAALVDFAAENRDLVRILFGREGEAGSLGDDVLDHLAAWLAAEIRLHRSRRANVEIAAQAIVGMWARTLAWWAEDPRRATPKQLLDTIVELQMHGVAEAPPVS